MNIPHPLQPSLTTPPESFTNAPLTPPPTEEKPNLPVLSRILKEIARRERGHNLSTQPWERLEVGESEYNPTASAPGRRFRYSSGGRRPLEEREREKRTEKKRESTRC
jgi:hypothetical protein